MLLDTTLEQRAAVGLYRSLGFEQTEAYYDVPDPLRGSLVFFRLALDETS